MKTYEVTTKGPSENSFCFSDDMYYGDRDKTIDATKNELSYNMFKLGEYDENTYNVGAWGDASEYFLAVHTQTVSNLAYQLQFCLYLRAVDINGILVALHIITCRESLADIGHVAQDARQTGLL